MAAGRDCPGFTKAEWRRWHGRGKRLQSFLYSWDGLNGMIPHAILCPECIRLLDAAVRSRTIPWQPQHHMLGVVELWDARYRRVFWQRWGDVTVIQGDSRNVLMSMGFDQYDFVLSSPPYIDTSIEQTHMTSNRRGDPSSPNYRPSWTRKLAEGYANTFRPYGTTPGQIGTMKEGKLDAVISSPPFLQQSGGHNVTAKSGPLSDAGVITRHAAGNKGAAAYGSTPGQIERMREGSLQMAVADMDHAHDTFWGASRWIAEQTYRVLKPGGVAIWVLKGFVRKKRYVDFPRMWQRLCEAVGFETTHWIRAWQVDHISDQRDIYGNIHSTVKEHKGFFRTMLERKGSPRIDYEVVLVMRKPA